MHIHAHADVRGGVCACRGVTLRPGGGCVLRVQSAAVKMESARVRMRMHGGYCILYTVDVEETTG